MTFSTGPTGKGVQRVLLVHNAYQHRGGEDAVVEAEAELLARHGVQVRMYQRHNDELSIIPKWKAAAQALWSQRTAREVTEHIADFKPDVVHVHNSFPLISPSVFWAAHRAGVPTVATLHNFRLLCAQAMLLRDGQVCQRCVGHSPWPAVKYSCYRGSATQSTVAAMVLQAHRWLGTWQDKVGRFIALTDYARDIFIAGGLPPERVVVKPNFVDLPNLSGESDRQGILFVGRLSHEKGLHVLADAAALSPMPQPITLVGDGPERAALQGRAGLQLVGAADLAQVVHRMRRAAALVLPSICIENFPRTLVEAMACGLPVIASRLGAMATLVEHGHTGLLFEPGDAHDLRRQIDWALAHPAEMAAMGRTSRQRYEAQFQGETNLRMLLDIYAAARGELCVTP